MKRLVNKMKKMINKVLVASVLLSGVQVGTSILNEDSTTKSYASSSNPTFNHKVNKSYYTTTSLNARAGWGTSYKVVKSIPKAKAIKVTAKKKINGIYWYKTTYGGKTGYVSGKYISVKKPTTISKVSNSVNYTSLNDRIINEGKKFLGVKYVWGASANTGMDCSGFVYRTLNAAGIKVPRYDSRQFYAHSQKISKSQLQKGDLVYFATGGGTRISHIAIYMGNGKLIHAYGKGVQISPLNNGYWNKLVVGYGRIK